MRIATLVLIAGLMTSAAMAEDQPPPIPHPHRIPLHIGGRYESKPPVSGVKTKETYWATYQWPGTYIEAAFEGDFVFIRLNDKANILNVLIDGKLVRTLKHPGKAIEAFKNLGPAAHSIRIERLTETQSETGSFEGVFIFGKTPLPLSPRPRQIEFIGASSSVGYGNTSSTRTCTKDEVWATTDATQAFPTLTAKHYNADYQINAYSGRGMVRNYDGIAPNEPLPALYPYILFDRKTLYKDPNWQPQIIIINLGGNDFSTPLHAGEKWADQGALKADFEASYVAFVKGLRAKNPKAFFILTTNDEPVVDAEVAKVFTTLKADGETRLDYIAMKDFGRNGCDWHFDLADHKKIFGIFTTYLDAHPELWQGK